MIKQTKFKNNGRFFNNLLLFLFILFLPTQLGKHFFFPFAYLSGVRVDYLAPTLYLTDIIALLLLLLNLKLVLKAFLKKKLLIFIGFLVVTVFVSTSGMLVLYGIAKLIELIIIFFVLRQTKKTDKLILIAFTIGALGEIIIAVLELIERHSVGGLFYFLGERTFSLGTLGIAKAALFGTEILRPYASFSHPNSLAGFYLLLYFFYLTKRNFENFFLKNILLLASSLIIFFSFAKFIILVFLFLNLVYLLRNTWKKCRLCTIAKIIIIGVLSLIFFQARGDPQDLEKRLLLTKDALRIFLNHSVLGVGLNNYLLYQQNFPIKYLDLLNQPVHNVFLLVLTEVGIVGTIMILVFLYKRIIKIVLSYPYVASAIILTGLFDHYWLTLQQNFLLLGVIAGLALF